MDGSIRLISRKDYVPNADENNTEMTVTIMDIYVVKDQEKIPIYWCAPECISPLYDNSNENYFECARYYTEKTDVWAFAITSWEVLTNAKQETISYPAQCILSITLRIIYRIKRHRFYLM